MPPFGQKPLSQEEELYQKNRDYHDHHLTDLEGINKTLITTIDCLENQNIPYALMGGVAGKELGRPRITHDIDLFVSPDDAEKILQTLERNGFSIERRDPLWLFKAWKNDVLVDIIFRSCGDIYFEQEVKEHVRRIPFQGKMINTISPEDFIVIKAAANREDGAHHWYDALAVLKQGSIDWDYLVRRSRFCPKRVLSLLIYAQGTDIIIPFQVIKKLFHYIYETPHSLVKPHFFPYISVLKQDDGYTKERIMEAINQNENVSDTKIKLNVTDSEIILRGEVFTNEQKNTIEDIVVRMAPKTRIKNLIQIREFDGPKKSEFVL